MPRQYINLRGNIISPRDFYGRTARGLNCNDCGSRPAGEVLSCRDKKVPKETLPGRSPRKKRAVPCAPQATRGVGRSASLRCGQRAVPTAPRKISGPDPRRPAVLGELRRGKVNCAPEVSPHKSRLTLKSALGRNRWCDGHSAI